MVSSVEDEREQEPASDEELSFKFPQKLLQKFILEVLNEKGAMHGYALSAELEQLGWKSSQTAVYNTLRALEAEEAVRLEERKENGRLQKIYSITPAGKAKMEAGQKKMRDDMLKIAAMIISILQGIGGNDNSQDEVRSAMIDFRDFARMALMVLHSAPGECHAIISTALASIRQLAEQNNIQVPEYDGTFDPERDMPDA